MKHILALAALVFATSCFGQVPDYVPTEGLVAWWDMNGDGEDSGPFQINPVNNGYLSGADRFGNASGAFNSNDTHINYGVHPEIQNESFSFATWINPTTPSGAAHRTLMGYHNDADGGATLGLLPDSRVKFHTNHWQYEGLASSEPIIAGTWAHLVGTYSQGVLSLYIDGQLDIELEGIESPNSNSENFEVGRWTGSATQYFNGLMDDVGVWNRRLDVSEILELYQSAPLVIGCTDSLACNFMPEANLDDDSCLDCALFEQKCGPGTLWDDASQLCIVANPSDTNFDGCVSMTDLLDLLTVFGTCNETPWSCGDPLEYQGYDYETVQIGEQCWFAENLRAENYRNGEQIASHDYSTNALEFGVLYRGAVLIADQNVCPAGWSVTSDDDWLELELFLGAESSEVQLFEYSDERLLGFGNELKPFSSNQLGFNAAFGGYLNGPDAIEATDLGVNGQWWTSTFSEDDGNLAIYRNLESWTSGISRIYQPISSYGFSIRCIKDSE